MSEYEYGDGGSDYDPDDYEDGYSGMDGGTDGGDGACIGAPVAEKQYSEGVGGPKFEDLVSETDKSAYRRYHPNVLEREAPYEVIEGNNAWPALVDAAAETSPTLYVEIPGTIQLMIGMGFDRRRLEQTWIDDREACLKAACMMDPVDCPYTPPSTMETPQEAMAARAAIRVGTSDVTVSSEMDAEDMCMVCFSSLPKSKIDAPPCGHPMCRDCWKQHLLVAAYDKGQFLNVTCAEQGCGKRLPYEMLLEYCSPDQLSKWQRWAGSAFAQGDEAVRECKNPACSRLHYFSRSVPIDVHCPAPCGYIQCFGCGSDGHFPATCSMQKRWIDKTAKDSASVAFIKDSTRPCPRCSLPIEK